LRRENRSSITISLAVFYGKKLNMKYKLKVIGIKGKIFTTGLLLEAQSSQLK
jgi:hypothetical protein